MITLVVECDQVGNEPRSQCQHAQQEYLCVRRPLGGRLMDASVEDLLVEEWQFRRAMQHKSVIDILPELRRNRRRFEWIIAMADQMLPHRVCLPFPCTLRLGLSFILQCAWSVRPLRHMLTWRGRRVNTISACCCASSTCPIGAIIITFDLAAPAFGAGDARSHLDYWSLVLWLIVYATIAPLLIGPCTFRPPIGVVVVVVVSPFSYR